LGIGWWSCNCPMTTSTPSGPPVNSETILWRRILPEWITWEDGRARPSSHAFKDRGEHKLSVVIASECPLRVLLRNRPEDSVVSFPAELPMSLGFKVTRDYDPQLPGHVIIDPAPNSKKAKQIALRSQWVLFRDPRSKWFRFRRRLRQRLGISV